MTISDPRTTPLYLIKQTAKELTRRGEARLRPFGLGFSSLPVLVALKNREATTQADLARLLGVEQPSMAQTLMRLERDGFIRRRPDPHHRRNMILELTPSALDRLPQARALLSADNARAMQGFTPEETQIFSTMLQRVGANLQDARSDADIAP